MNQHFTDPVATVEQAISKLQKEALSREAGAILSISINDVTKPKILQQQTEYPLLHWKSRDEDCQYYCWGISELFISLQEIDSDSLMPSFVLKGISLIANRPTPCILLGFNFTKT